MSDTGTLTEKVGTLTTEVQKSQGMLLQGIGRLEGHEEDPVAHGIENPGSPFRSAIEKVVMDTMLDADPNSTAQKIIASRVATAITSALPDAIAAELKNPVSNLATLVSDRINEDINKKIQSGELGDAVTSIISDAQSTANLAKQEAGEAKANAATALSAANGAKATAEAALPKTGTATAASKLETPRNLQVDLGSTSATAFDGSANKDIGVKGTLGLANGGTGAATANAACDQLGAIKKSGDRGALAGSETASVVNGSQSINAASADCMNITTSGAVTLTFTPAAANVRAVKSLCLTAGAATTLTVSGASWANSGSAPNWGSAGKRLVLLAHFVAGLVILSVADNNE